MKNEMAAGVGGDGSVKRVCVTCNALWLCNSLKPIKQAPSRVLKRRVVRRCRSSLLNLPCELHDDRQDTHTRVGEYPYMKCKFKRAMRFISFEIFVLLRTQHREHNTHHNRWSKIVGTLRCFRIVRSSRGAVI